MKTQMIHFVVVDEDRDAFVYLNSTQGDAALVLRGYTDAFVYELRCANVREEDNGVTPNDFVGYAKNAKQIYVAHTEKGHFAALDVDTDPINPSAEVWVFDIKSVSPGSP